MFFITKKIALFWGVILVCISTVLSSSSHALERKVADLVTAYGYVIGQNHSLDLIQKKFPNLKGYTDYCKNYLIDSSFKNILKNKYCPTYIKNSVEKKISINGSKI